MSGKVIGIDLGTSNSVVSVLVNGEPVVIPDAQGRTIHSSVVAFLPDGEILVGNDAVPRKIIDPVNTVYSAKRLIGRPFFSEEVRIAQTHYPYEVVCGEDNNPKIVASGREYSAEEISAMILTHMRDLAEAYLGERIDRAIITVPANFNEGQRTATKVAGEIAGLEVVRILNEPTAAALAYGYGQGRREKVVIYDFGGGTFDITVLDLRDSVFEVLSTAGNTYLGGDDFDNRLVDFMVAAFHHRYAYDLSTEIVAMQRLKNIAEQVKCDLSEKDKVAVQIQEMIPGSAQPVVLSFSLTREGFYERCQDIVQQTFLVCDEALRLAELTHHEIDHVVLVGGTTRMPLVRDMVSRYFVKEPVGDINPDEVVAVGAAIFAASLEADSGGGRSALLIDVTPQALGIATAGGFCDTVIERNENIPTERSRTFTTNRDYQDVVKLEILEGDSRRAEENRKIGELMLEGVRPAPRGQVQIQVTFEIDTDGILNVSAVDVETGLRQSARLAVAGSLSSEEAARLRAQANYYEDEGDGGAYWPDGAS